MIKIEKNPTKNVFKDFLKKILILSIVAINIFCYLPVASFAADDDTDDEKKVPATVPSVANEIISKFVVTRTLGENATFTGTAVNYPEEGDGYHQLIEVANKKYKDFKQYEGSYAGISYWDGNISSSGCGLVSCSIILSGYGIDVTPADVCEKMKSEVANYTNSVNLSTLLSSYGLSNERKTYSDYSGILNDVRGNLQAGRPVLVGINGTSDGTYSNGGHWMVILGESDGHIITANPGRNSTPSDDTLENFLSTQMSPGCAYIMITQDYNGGNNSNSNSNSNNNSNSHSDNNNNSNNQQTNNSSGYSGVHKSSITGREFKEYKQDSPEWASVSYANGNTIGHWGCGLTSDAILCTGYGHDVTPVDINSKFSGGYSIGNEMASFTGESNHFESITNYSVEQLMEYLRQGCTFIIHCTSSNPRGNTLDFCASEHYMAVIDVDGDKVYLSNPWSTGPTGWLDKNYVFGSMDVICIFSKDGGGIGNYGGGTTSSGSTSSSMSSVNMGGKIVSNSHGGYKIDINLDDEVDGMLKTLKKKNFKMENYLSSSHQKEYLKNFIKAAIVTQYPDLRSADEIARDEEIPEDETQGCIKVKRYSDEETRAFAGNGTLSNPVDNEDEKEGMYLSYKPYSQFSQLIQNGDKSALNYFSLNSSNSIVVAGWETSEVDISIQQIAGDQDPEPDPVPQPRNTEYSRLSEKSINYINQITNYTVPFSFMWSLLVYGHDEEFANDFAKLVIDTDIVIGAYDATDVRTNTYTYTYQKNRTTQRTAQIGDYSVESGYEAEAPSTEVKHYTYQVIEQHTLKTNNTKIKIVYANTWTAIYNNNYTLAVNEQENESLATMEDEHVSYNWNNNRNEDEIDKIVNEDEDLKSSIESQIQELKKQTHEYNQREFAYRYPIINDAIDEIAENAGKAGELLKKEDVQNYLINMIILGNGEEYIQNLFEENEVIDRAVKEVSEENSANIKNEAASYAKIIVSDSTKREEGETSLRDKLIKNGQDTRTNKVYSAHITSIEIEEDTNKTDQQETIKTYIKNTRVEEITNANGNVKLKVDKNSQENSFVKLLSNSKKAKDNLRIIDSWFFESMEKTAAIADKVDTVKYLFQFVYEKDYGYTREDAEKIINLFDPEGFTSINNGESGSAGAGYSSITISQSDKELLYKLVYAEWGCGTQEQQEYIASVVLNRVLCTDWPNTVRDVIYQDGQFQPTWSSAMNLYDSANEELKSRTRAAVDSVIANGDTTGGAIGFMNDWLYDSDQNKSWNNESNGWKELFRETDSLGNTMVFFTKTSASEELKRYESSSTLIPSDVSDKARTVIEAAKSKLGCPYVWGGSGPDQFDCGGLTMWCYAQAGINISHSNQKSDAQRMGQVLDISKAKPGDILYRPGHVGLCVSNENGIITYIHAPQPGDVVRYATWAQFTNALRFF